VIAGGNDVGAEVEELFCDGGRDAEAAGRVFAVDDEEIDGVGFKDVGEMFADDVAAGGAKDIADKEDIHWKSLHGGVLIMAKDRGGGRPVECGIRVWVW
jgi:hypothetical protein